MQVLCLWLFTCILYLVSCICFFMDKALQQQYLQAMEIQAWELRDYGAGNTGGKIQAAGAEPEAAPHAQIDISAMGWEALQECVSQCVACDLHASRTQTVFGVGDHRAQLMIIGEAPGADEDREGEPFVGQAGQLLNEMLYAIGFTRQQVYITNILKCHPPGNRDPHVAEVACCEQYLLRQIELLQPRLILAVGRIAAQNLLKTDASLDRLRGRRHTLRAGAVQVGVPVVVSYHPAYLLRSPTEKQKVWQDLQFAMRLFNGAENN